MTRTMDASTTALRDSLHHNVPPPADGVPYVYEVNLGTPRSMVHRSPLSVPLHANSPYYGQQIGGLASPGQALLDFDDMKVSSLPMNPLTGAAPIIDPASSQSVENVPPKKPRYSPAQMSSPAHQHMNPTLSGHYTPGAPQQTTYNAGIAGMAMGVPLPGMSSPLHLGGPLQNGMATPIMQGRTTQMNGMNALNVPQTPVMGMMNGVMNFGMAGMPFNMAYPTSPILSPSMNPGIMTGNYGPAAAAAAAAAAGNATGRTVYIGNLPADELLNLVRFGPIENVRLLPERSCVFISFLDGSTAAAFHADAQVKKLALHGQELKIGWGKASQLQPQIQASVQQSQATRNVFVGNLAESTTEQDLRDELSKFGPIDQVKIVRDKNIGFVHFLSIATAIKVVKELPLLAGWTDKRVNYGKDRCAYVPKAQQAAVQIAQQQALAAVHSQHSQMPATPFQAFTPMTPGFSTFSAPATPAFSSPAFPSTGFPAVTTGIVSGNASFAGQHDASGSSGANRNVYLGNIHPDTSTEELCNNIRGGQLQAIKHMHDKNCAFVTFIDAASAQKFYEHATSTGLTINSRRLKVGWGKSVGSLPPAVLQAVQSGASRNVYVGSIPDFDLYSEMRLRQDFGVFGEIEMINFLREKGAAFINFTNIQSAQTAIEGIKANPAYSDLRISYGKDRCANAPRAQAAQTPRPAPMRNESNHDPNDVVARTIAAAEAKSAGQTQPTEMAFEDEELVDVPASYE